MSHIETIEVHRYYPNGIKRIIGRGGESYIGVVDESTVLKYPCIPGITSNLRLESQFLKILGNHPRIIGSKGLTDDGLRLEYAANGDLNGYITANPGTSLDQRLQWCRQAAEAVEYSHKKRVIHCDISLRNLLLDENLDLKLADFQGMYKSCDGNVHEDDNNDRLPARNHINVVWVAVAVTLRFPWIAVRAPSCEDVYC